MVKRIGILIIVILIIFMPKVNAAGGMDGVINQADKFLQDGKTDGRLLLDGDKIKNSVGDVYNILVTIGVALSVIVGAILAIKFMIGSIEEQAKIKEMLIPYVLGCFVIFGAFGIWRMVMALGGNIFN